MKYNRKTHEFVSNNGEVFGYLMGVSNHFYYVDYPMEYSLNEMFGDITPELLFNYLKKRFPEVEISGVE